MRVIKYFYSENCGFCEQMKPRIANLIRNGWDIEVFDVDEDTDISNIYDIEEMPTFVLEVDAEEVDRWVGVTEERIIQQKLMR
jgi:thioredoxin-like negative regulator of GroEL